MDFISICKLLNFIILVSLSVYQTVKLIYDEPERKKKSWNLWTEETRYEEERDTNEWYIIPGNVCCQYKGEWKDGLPNGKGVKEFFGTTNISHSIMEGNFVDGFINGFGKQTYDITRDEEKFAPYYEGEFKNGKHHGFGTYYYGCGSYRRGNLIDGKFIGRGIFYSAKTNRTWIGEFVDDVRNLDSGKWVDGEIAHI